MLYQSAYQSSINFDCCLVEIQELLRDYAFEDYAFENPPLEKSSPCEILPLVIQELHIVLKLFTTENEWAEYWRKRMDLNQSVMLNFSVLEMR